MPTVSVAAGLWVTLSWAEVHFAASVGVMRQIQAQRRGRLAAHCAGETGKGAWQIHIDGAIGECAFAKATGQFWDGTLLDTIRNGDGSAVDDVGSWHVRTSDGPTTSLIVHDDDPDEKRFAHVRGTAPTFEIVGWLRAKDAKQPAYWRTNVRNPAYFVPDAPLVKVFEIPERVYVARTS